MFKRKRGCRKRFVICRPANGALVATSPEGIEKKPDRIRMLVIIVNRLKDRALDAEYFHRLVIDVEQGTSRPPLNPLGEWKRVCVLSREEPRAQSDQTQQGNDKCTM